MPDLPISSQQPVGGSNYQPQSGETLPITQAKPVEESKDTLSASSMELPQAQAKETASMDFTTTSPVLPKPKTKHVSLLDFLTAVGNAQFNFQQIIQDSQEVNQRIRLQKSDMMVLQTEAVINKQREIFQTIENIEKQTAALIEQYQNMSAEIEELVKMQNELIKQLEAGNANEKQQFADLAAAYKTYTDGLKALGAIDDGKGNYTIPQNEAAQAKADKLTADYQQSVDKFNNYWEGRLAEINKYNQAAEAYNEKASEMNQSLNDFIDEYGLDKQLAKNSVPLVKQRDTAGYSASIPGPAKTGSKIFLSPLPAFVGDIAKNGPKLIPQLSYKPVDATTFHDQIYNKLYNDQVPPLQEELSQDINRLAYLHLRACQQVIDAEEYPILNYKSLSQLLLPKSTNTHSPSKKSIGTDSIWKIYGVGVLSEKILARGTIQRILAESSLKEEEQTEQKKLNEKLAEQLMFLSVEQLSRLSRDALLQSAQKSGSSLASLPKESPVFAILFALVLAKNIQESAQNDWTSREVEAFTDQNSDFPPLSEDQRKSLGTAISTSQLLIAGKLLEANIGLPNLFANLLLAQMPPEQALSLRTQTASENLQAQSALQNQLASHFKNNGFSEDKANFLAKMGADGIFNGTWSAPPVALVSSANINLPLFVDSLVASLILTHPSLSLTDALPIAQKTAQRALASGPFHSTAGFREALEGHLNSLGIRESSTLIANQAVLITKDETSSSSKNWKLQLNDYLQPLLSPHLGKQQTEELTKEISDVLNTLPQAITTQSKSQPSQYTNDLISESLKNNSDLYSLLTSLNNPAPLFALAVAKGRIQFNQDLVI